MGNIYFEQQKYPAAIKMYRMALDQVPLTSRSVRNRILRNIGIAFMHVGQYQVSHFTQAAACDHRGKKCGPWADKDCLNLCPKMATQ